MTIVSELVTSTVTRRVAYLHCDNHSCHSKAEVGAAERYENCSPLPDPELPMHWLKHAIAAVHDRMTYAYYCSPRCAHAANKPVHIKATIGGKTITETVIQDLHKSQTLDVVLP